MNIVFLALFLIVHNPADAATPNKPFLIIKYGLLMRSCCYLIITMTLVAVVI